LLLQCYLLDVSSNIFFFFGFASFEERWIAKKVLKQARNSYKIGKPLSLSLNLYCPTQCQFCQHLQVAFLYESVLRSFSAITDCVCNFSSSGNWGKSCKKMLVKLTS